MKTYKFVDGYLVRARRKRKLQPTRKFLNEQGYDYNGQPLKRDIPLNLPDDWLKQLQAVYPRRRGGQGWGYVKRRVPDLIKEGNDFEDILAGAKSYGDYCKATGEEYVRMARTFFGPDEWWAEDYHVETFTPRRAPAPVTEEQLKRDREKAEKELNDYMRVVK